MTYQNQSINQPLKKVLGGGSGFLVQTQHYHSRFYQASWTDFCFFVSLLCMDLINNLITDYSSTGP